MTCPHCGTQVKEGQLFCVECGRKIERPNSPPQVPPTPASGSYQTSPGEATINGAPLMEPVRYVGFREAVVNFFKNYARFEGRATRREFWLVAVFNTIISTALSLIFEPLSGLYALIVLVPSLAVTWRRLHDMGKSGLWWLMNLIPLVGWIFVLVSLCQDSQWDNQYGSRKTENNRVPGNPYL